MYYLLVLDSSKMSNNKLQLPKSTYCKMTSVFVDAKSYVL